ncbi:MAG: hypothetical protein WC806_03570 [Candidatus Gracilibacteria bacterium]|jgi:hypothetical protein
MGKNESSINKPWTNLNEALLKEQMPIFSVISIETTCDYDELCQLYRGRVFDMINGMEDEKEKNTLSPEEQSLLDKINSNGPLMKSSNINPSTKNQIDKRLLLEELTDEYLKKDPGHVSRQICRNPELVKDKNVLIQIIKSMNVVEFDGIGKEMSLAFKKAVIETEDVDKINSVIYQLNENEFAEFWNELTKKDLNLKSILWTIISQYKNNSSIIALIDSKLDQRMKDFLAVKDGNPKPESIQGIIDRLAQTDDPNLKSSNMISNLMMKSILIYKEITPEQIKKLYEIYCDKILPYLGNAIYFENLDKTPREILIRIIDEIRSSGNDISRVIRILRNPNADDCISQAVYDSLEALRSSYYSWISFKRRVKAEVDLSRFSNKEIWE